MMSITHSVKISKLVTKLKSGTSHTNIHAYSMVVSFFEEESSYTTGK
jgi:hypothetical protein